MEYSGESTQRPPSSFLMDIENKYFSQIYSILLITAEIRDHPFACQ